MKRWLLRRTKIDTKEISKSLGIFHATACVLANRGITTYKVAKSFLDVDDGELNDAFLMKDMELGVNILKTAIEMGKKIAVYGDYDVDGVTSTSILYQVISICGGDVIYYVPNRKKEGYGLNNEAVCELYEQGVSVLLTCDNGISAIEEIKLAKEKNMQVVVLDHHEPSFIKEDGKEDGKITNVLPIADAIIDPKQHECSYPFTYLCAGAIAYKFAVELLKVFDIKDDKAQKEFLTLAAIATVCDIVDLLDENRVIVQKGLKYISETTNLGIRALIEETGLNDKKITEYHIGFVIGPCINASGRLESARLAIRLFNEKDKELAHEYAKKLVLLNQIRKEMTLDATLRVQMKVKESDMLIQSVLVVFEEELHESIAGIVAGRLKETFYRPVVVITKAENSAKGSARSIEGFNMFEALYKCKDLFLHFGGHPMAAGFSLDYKNIDGLRKRLNSDCKLTNEELTPIIKIEKQLGFDEIHLELAFELRKLAPFGKSNPTPIFASKNIFVERFSLIGKNKNIIRFDFYDKSMNMRLNGISFDGFDEFKKIISDLYGENHCNRIFSTGKLKEEMDIVYTVDINSYMGRDSVQLNIKDFRISKISKIK